MTSYADILWDRHAIFLPHKTYAEAKGTFLALCLLSSRSGLQTLDPEKFNGQQRDFATIMWTLNQSGEQIRLQEFVFFFYQILAQMLEVCLELEKWSAHSAKPLVCPFIECVRNYSFIPMKRMDILKSTNADFESVGTDFSLFSFLLIAFSTQYAGVDWL